jgi:hypothetical protein
MKSSELIGLLFILFGLWITYKILTNDTEGDNN